MNLSTKKLILFWDDVFQQLLEEIKQLFQDESAKILPQLLEKILLFPLRDLLLQSINYIFTMIINPHLYVFLQVMVDNIIFGLYLITFFLIICQLIFALIKSMYLFTLDTKILPSLIKPLQKILILHGLQFIGFPLTIDFIEYYPQFIQNIYEMMSELIKQDILFVDISLFDGKYILLEVVLLVIIFYCLLKVLLQFIRQGIMVLLSFIKCYINLIYTHKIEGILQPVQEQVVHILFIYMLQQVLLIELPIILVKHNNYYGLLIIASLAIIIAQLPNFYKYMFKGSE